MSENETITINRINTDNFFGENYNCILFNDNSHSALEVIIQVIKATGYNKEKAIDIVKEAHNKGKSIVITAHKERVELVSEILKQINLKTEIEKA